MKARTKKQQSTQLLFDLSKFYSYYQQDDQKSEISQL